MNQKYNPEIHNRHSIRLKNYDYSKPGVYFITICVHERKCLFGNIINNSINLNDAGKMVEKCWFDLKNHYNNIELDEFIIMPNHFHGIIVINNSVGAGSSRPNLIRPNISRPNLNEGNNNNSGQDSGCIPTGRMIQTGRDNRAPTLGKIIAYYKYQTTKQINELRNQGIQKIWQRNYYEHIVRNEKELYQIREYIKNNPINWDNDENNI